MNLFFPKIGGHRLKADDLIFLQTAYLEGFKAMASFLDISTNTIVSGVNTNTDVATVSYTEGYVFWQGELFKVDSGSFDFISGGLLFLALSEEVVPPSPITYKNNTLQNVHFQRKMRLVYYSAGLQGEYLSNFSRASLTGVKTGSVSDWYGNVNLNFDNTGLGINNMTGYAICNGVNGTPDLRGRFIVMASNVPNTGAPTYQETTLGTYIYNSTGGTKVSILSQANLPNVNFNVTQTPHTHTIRGDVRNSFGGAGAFPAVQPDSQEGTVTSDPSIVPITVNSGGASAEFENRPPFFALIKIMKIN